MRMWVRVAFDVLLLYVLGLMYILPAFKVVSNPSTSAILNAIFFLTVLSLTIAVSKEKTQGYSLSIINIITIVMVAVIYANTYLDSVMGFVVAVTYSVIYIVNTIRHNLTLKRIILTELNEHVSSQ